ncbi:MAG TPA: hypothetical protein VFQ79_15575 [Bryobacteraceae bacterium]|nr:hypothetical protein [Bryobacteraceae bacterium]
MQPIDRPALERIRPEDIFQQIDLICGSHSFRNRESFRKLLTYLAGKTLDGSAEYLKEYTVGIELFGKPENYDPREDAAVRVAISKLRQKLEEYYVGEGKDDSVVIELPRRQLALTWHVRQPAFDAMGRQLPAVPARPHVERPSPWRLIGAAAVLCVVAFLTGRQFAPTPAASVPVEVGQFWRPLLADGRPVLISLGTPMFVRMRGARVRAGHEDIASAQEDPRIRQIQTLFDSPDTQASYIYTGVGEAAAAFRLAKLFSRWNVDLRLRRNSALTWEDIGNNNLIILGSAKYNPKIRNLPVEQSFLVEQGGVTNLHPGTGEPAAFRRRYADDPERSIIEDFAVISRLPGVNGRGVIVAVGASATEGTAAAVDYMTDPARLRELFGHLKGASGEVPKYFEAVLRVEFREMVPVRTDYRTHREVRP